MKRGSEIFVLFSLWLTLLFGGTVKEFAHLFADHKDTEHVSGHICPKGEAHWDEVHHHCAFLGFVLDHPFVPATAQDLRAKPEVFFRHFTEAVAERFISFRASAQADRGPPATA